MINKDFTVEIACSQVNKHGQEVCGDVFLSRKIKEENRVITVLSDGLGSGVKANVLAMLTAAMGLNFTIERYPMRQTARTILDTLPVDKDRKISYATFTIADIDADGTTRLAEFDNPASMLIRGQQVKELENRKEVFHSHQDLNREIVTSGFAAMRGDRLIMISDGISQSGIGTARYPFGWGRRNTAEWICSFLEEDPSVSASVLAARITAQAMSNDVYKAKDDISCVVIYYRKPRKLLVCSGPPFHSSQDERLAGLIKNFDGQKVICGGTTANIISRELGLKVSVGIDGIMGELPPVSQMEGIDLVTEGVLTMGRVTRLLEEGVTANDKGSDAASRLVRLLLNNDLIMLMAGTRINQAHQDPALPVELEIRRNLVKKIKWLLEEKYLKEVHLDFI